VSLSNPEYGRDVRKDANGKQLDNRMTYHRADGTEQDFGGIYDLGGEIANDVGMAAPTGVSATGTSGTLTVTFGTVTNADDYYVEYYLNSAPTSRSAKTGSGSPVAITGLTSGVYSARVMPRNYTGRAAQKFVQGPFSSVASGTVT
jgi:hypothetical protein